MIAARVLRSALVALVLLAISGCAGPAVSVPAWAGHGVGAPRKDVWVVRHGWHTRVAMRGGDIDPSIWPERRDFGEAAFLEVGWGDRDFYSKAEASVWDAIDPVLRATPAVLHVVAYDRPPPAVWNDQTVVRLAVPAAGIDRLARFVHDHYARDPAGNAVRLRPGYYPRSAFYLALGRYHALSYNSNDWTASALRTAGVPIQSTPVMTAGTVMGEVAAIAATQREPPTSRLAEGRPSLTAQVTANLRAAHQLVDQPRIFEDPLALRIIGREAEAAVRARAGRGPAAQFRPFVAARSRYAENELAAAVRRGVRQYVVLGAGLDTFAYRNPHPVSRLRVFEVDHPATQAWKRARLREAGIALPESLVFAGIDFETQTLASGLRQAGFDAAEPAFVSMLGVVIYLTRAAVMNTLMFVGSLPAGTEIVFDYAIPPSALSEAERGRHDAEARRVAARGEPWLTYFEPAVVAGELRAIGFTHIEDLGPDEIHERYFKDRPDGLRPSGIARLLKAGRR
jgi:uncharacterized protein (TIGR02117 family)